MDTDGHGRARTGADANGFSALPVFQKLNLRHLRKLPATECGSWVFGSWGMVFHSKSAGGILSVLDVRLLSGGVCDTSAA
jgi:hypothetical protein